MIDDLKKLIVLETLLLMFFYITGMISLYMEIMPFYLLSCMGIFAIIIVFVKTIFVTLDTFIDAFHDQLENDNQEVVKKDYRN